MIMNTRTGLSIWEPSLLPEIKQFVKMLRKISAQYIFPGDARPLKRGIIVISEQGDIIDIIDNHGNLEEIGHLEFYNGIITPGL